MLDNNLHDYVAATVRPRYEDRGDGRFEVWIDLMCRDKHSAKKLKRRMDLPGSVRGSVLRFRTPHLWAVCQKLGLAPEVGAAASKLDRLMKRVSPTPQALKEERAAALRAFGQTFRDWTFLRLERRA